MIKYKLICKSCEICFDSWFASSLEYEKLKKKNYLICHNCNSIRVEKTLMAPKLINKKSFSETLDKKGRFKKIDKTIKEFQKFIKNNFEYVGESFSYEARSIHYNKKKRKKGIYGLASDGELKDLKEEGIETKTIPWIKDKNN